MSIADDTEPIADDTVAIADDTAAPEGDTAEQLWKVGLSGQRRGPHHLSAMEGQVPRDRVFLARSIAQDSWNPPFQRNASVCEIGSGGRAGGNCRAATIPPAFSGW